MTDELPERLYLDTLYENSAVCKWDRPRATAYLRADTAIPRAEADAMVAAEKERLTEMLVDLVSKPMPGRLGESGVPWVGWSDAEYKTYLRGWSNYRDMVCDLLIAIREEPTE